MKCMKPRLKLNQLQITGWFHSSIQNIDCVFDAIENTRECVEPVLISKQICCLEKSPF